jgi:hypothetical protein
VSYEQATDTDLGEAAVHVLDEGVAEFGRIDIVPRPRI